MPAIAADDPREELCADGFLTIEEAAEFCGVGTRLIYKLMDQGLPWVKVGRHRKIPKRGLIRFVAQDMKGTV